MRIPETTPGMEAGKTTRRKVVIFVAPRLALASSMASSIRSRAM